MLRWHALAVSLVLSFCLSSEARAQQALACPPPEPPATSEEFVAWLDCTLVELQTIWREDVVAGILSTKPDVQRISNLPLTFVSDCDYSPRLIDTDDDGALEVVVNARLTIPQMMVSQAVLWYLVAPDTLADAQAHLTYLDQVLLPTVRQDQRVCDPDGTAFRYNQVSIPSFFHGAPQQHPLFLGSDSPTTRRIGDFVGGLPLFFAMIHEAGHAALHVDPPLPSFKVRETQADLFAAEVFTGNRVPVTLGLAYVLLAYDMNIGGARASVACRIVDLAKQAGVRDAELMADYGQQTVQRLEVLRLAYIQYYSGRCAAGD